MKTKHEFSDKSSTCIKCVLVGDAGVGKSSLATRIASGQFKDEYVPTLFDNYAATVMLDEKPFHLSLFDTAGKEDYGKLRVLSYMNCDVFLICFSAVSRDSLTSVEKHWVPEIRHYLPNTPYILISCQSDLRGLHAANGVNSISDVSLKEANEVKDKCGAACHVECSSLTKDGVSDIVRETIETVLRDIDYKRDDMYVCPIKDKTETNKILSFSITKPLSGDLFDKDALAVIFSHMTAALEMASKGKACNQIPVNVDPSTNTVIAKSYDLHKGEHPLHHATMTESIYGQRAFVYQDPSTGTGSLVAFEIVEEKETFKNTSKQHCSAGRIPQHKGCSCVKSMAKPEENLECLSCTSEHYEPLQRDNIRYVDYVRPTLFTNAHLRASQLLPSRQPSVNSRPLSTTNSNRKFFNNQEENKNLNVNQNTFQKEFMIRGTQKRKRIYLDVEDEKARHGQKNLAFDSGVGDLEHIHIDGILTQPKYDYVDYGHQYEELFNIDNIAKTHIYNRLDSHSEQHQSSGSGTSRTTTEVASQMGDNSNVVNTHNGKRKRMNPVYDAMTQSIPNIRNKNKLPGNEGLQRQIQYLKCSLLVLVVVCCASLVISFVSITGYLQTKDDTDSAITTNMQRQTEDNNKLEKLLSFLNGNNVTGTILLSNFIQLASKFGRNLSSDMQSIHERLDHLENISEKNTNDIQDKHNNISHIVSFLNTTIQLQLYSLSKQPGPMGKQGVANFSMCRYYNLSYHGSASDKYPSYSPWAPSLIDLNTNFAIFATCSVDNGTQAILETLPNTSNRVQFRCKCSGVVEGHPKRICWLHLLTCPRES